MTIKGRTFTLIIFRGKRKFIAVECVDLQDSKVKAWIYEKGQMTISRWYTLYTERSNTVPYFNIDDTLCYMTDIYDMRHRRMYWQESDLDKHYREMNKKRFASAPRTRRYST